MQHPARAAVNAGVTSSPARHLTARALPAKIQPTNIRLMPAPWQPHLWPFLSHPQCDKDQLTPCRQTASLRFTAPAEPWVPWQHTDAAKHRPEVPLDFLPSCPIAANTNSFPFWNTGWRHITPYQCCCGVPSVVTL